MTLSTCTPKVWNMLSWHVWGWRSAVATTIGGAIVPNQISMWQGAASAASCPLLLGNWGLKHFKLQTEVWSISSFTNTANWCYTRFSETFFAKWKRVISPLFLHFCLSSHSVLGVPGPPRSSISESILIFGRTGKVRKYHSTDRNLVYNQRFFCWFQGNAEDGQFQRMPNAVAALFHTVKDLKYHWMIATESWWVSHWQQALSGLWALDSCSQWCQLVTPVL